MISIPTRTELGARLRHIITGLCEAIHRRAAPVLPRVHPILALLALVQTRLCHALVRFDRLAALWHAGRLPKPRPARPGRARAAAPATPRPYIPRGKGWLIRLAQRSAVMRGQLETMLADPETQALVAAAPQAARHLRPLCRMLAVAEPSWLRPPPRPAAPARATPRPRPAPRPGNAPARRGMALLLAPSWHPIAGPNFRASHVFRG